MAGAPQVPLGGRGPRRAAGGLGRERVLQGGIPARPWNFWESSVGLHFGFALSNRASGLGMRGFGTRRRARKTVSLVCEGSSGRWRGGSKRTGGREQARVECRPRGAFGVCLLSRLVSTALSRWSGLLRKIRLWRGDTFVGGKSKGDASKGKDKGGKLK